MCLVPGRWSGIYRLSWLLISSAVSRPQLQPDAKSYVAYESAKERGTAILFSRRGRDAAWCISLSKGARGASLASGPHVSRLQCFDRKHHVQFDHNSAFMASHGLPRPIA
ncbi:hypothetical protein BDV96DRAFT_37680 [Lophiotrema nucula]|uniref:Secreted protein n=1 Tax=Lophiotrema nucula TaxID=690887 RepID=A0A6A5ZBJ2_9PLEO|nr:hypothetical protein BDV96DRAFT_37680 [Lophiotrema nucula]